MNEKKINLPDVGEAMRLAFGKCPKCGQMLEHGNVLRWCSDKRRCGWYGPK